MDHISRNSRYGPGRTLWSASCVAVGLVLILASGSLSTRASTLAPTDQGQGLNPLTIAAGQTATLTVRGFVPILGNPFLQVT